MAKHTPEEIWRRLHERRDKALRQSSACRDYCSLLECLPPPLCELAAKARGDLEQAEQTITVLPLSGRPPVELAVAVANVNIVAMNAAIDLYASCVSAGFSAAELDAVRAGFNAAEKEDTHDRSN